MEAERATLAEIKHGTRVQAALGGQVFGQLGSGPNPGDPAPTPPETDDHVQVLYPPLASQPQNSFHFQHLCQFCSANGKVSEGTIRVRYFLGDIELTEEWLCIQHNKEELAEADDG